MNNQPIGIFDSGIGGISILKEINKILPNENIIYLADNKNCPYGNKSISNILKLSLKNTSTLIQMNCKVIVIACNTATTNSIKEIRNSFSVPIIGIEPAIKPAINNTKTNKIGILATEKTLTSTHFNRTSNKFSNKVKIGMVGINIPIPVPMAFHSFGGWKRSLFGDQHMHGPEGIRFYTKLKTITSKWPTGLRSDPEFVMPTMK